VVAESFSGARRALHRHPKEHVLRPETWLNTTVPHQALFGNEREDQQENLEEACHIIAGYDNTLNAYREPQPHPDRHL
jgi:hypothetical protein